MKSLAAVPALLLAFAIAVLMFVLDVWTGLPSYAIETKESGTLDMPNKSIGRKSLIEPVRLLFLQSFNVAMLLSCR